jgi:hypothetical protein
MLNDPRIVNDVTGAADLSALDGRPPGIGGLPEVEGTGRRPEIEEFGELPGIERTEGLPEIGGTRGSGEFPDTGGLAALRGKLYDTVSRFPVLPAADPGRSDAAFCLFLHVHASSELRLRPEWPAVAARLLGITAGPDEAVATRETVQATGEAVPTSSESVTAANRGGVGEPRDSDRDHRDGTDEQRDRARG